MNFLNELIISFFSKNNCFNQKINDDKEKIENITNPFEYCFNVGIQNKLSTFDSYYY